MMNSDVIKLARKERLWSQDHLASIAGISVRTLQRIERGGTASLESKKALASALELSSSDLFNADEKQSTEKFGSPLYGYLGVFSGMLCAYAAITYSVFQGVASGGEVGGAYGIVAAFSGASCYLIGRYRQKDPVL